jgi:hypothetical protein
MQQFPRFQAVYVQNLYLILSEPTELLFVILITGICLIKAVVADRSEGFENEIITSIFHAFAFLK